MVRTHWAYWKRGWRRVRWRAASFVVRTPAIRKASPWALAIAMNCMLAALMLLIVPKSPPRGTSESETVVDVFVVPPPPAPVVVEAAPLDDLPEEALPPPSEVTQLEPAEQTPEPVIAIAPPAPPSDAVAAIPDQGISLPDVVLPTTDRGKGTPDGVVALNCYAVFRDPDKAAECAGREIRSGWKAAIADIGSDWARIDEEMRRGGVPVPAYGPDPLAGLGENSFIYQPADRRFREDSFDPRQRRYNRAFDSPAELARYRAQFDPRTYVGDGGSVEGGYGISELVPLSGWRPSWQLREDPYITQRDLNEIIVDDDTP